MYKRGDLITADIINQLAGTKSAGPETMQVGYGTFHRKRVVSVAGGGGTPQLAWIKLTNVSLHPMQGLIQAFNPDTGTLNNDWRFWNDPVDVYRYPTHTNNDLYETNNIIAAVRVAENKYISLHTLPIQLAVSTYSDL